MSVSLARQANIIAHNRAAAAAARPKAPRMKPNPLLLPSPAESEALLKEKLINDAPKSTLANFITGLQEDKERARIYVAAKETATRILTELTFNWNKFVRILYDPELKLIEESQQDYVGTLLTSKHLDTLLTWINTIIPKERILVRDGKEHVVDPVKKLHEILSTIIHLWNECTKALDPIVKMRQYIDTKACIKEPDVLSSLRPHLLDYAALLEWVADEKALHRWYTEENINKCIDTLNSLVVHELDFTKIPDGPSKLNGKFIRISPVGACSDLQIILLKTAILTDKKIGTITYIPLYEQVFPFPNFTPIVESKRKETTVMTCSFESCGFSYNHDIETIKLYNNDLVNERLYIHPIIAGGRRHRTTLSCRRRSGARRKSTHRRIRSGSRSVPDL